MLAAPIRSPLSELLSSFGHAETSDEMNAESEQSGTRLRIAHVTNYQVPGYGYEEIQLSREQARMGHDVTIVTSNYLYPLGPYSILRRRFSSRRVEPRDEVVDGVRIRRLASHEFARRVWIHGLTKLIRELSPHVIHCHNLLQFHPGRVALLRYRGRCNGAIIVDDHMHRGFMRRTAGGRLFYAAYRTIGQPLLARHVDRFCAIAEDTREYMQQECGVTGNINVIPLGVDVAAFAPNTERRLKARQRLALTASDLVLLYTGKVIPEKGVHLIVAAAAQLRSEGMRISVLVVGDADEAYARTLTTLASAGGNPLDLHIIPSVEHDHLPEWYAAADIGIWPRQESMAVFEGMAAGLPVVVSSMSGLARVVAPERGLIYSPEESVSLAACIRGLAASEIRERLGQAGQEYATNQLSWRFCAERYVALYRQVIAGRGRR